MDRSNFIREALAEATRLVQTKYADRSQLAYDEKEASDLLTSADIEVQHLLINRLRTHWKDESILAEEEGFNVADQRAQARCWIIDPIDGTYNFARDLFPLFGISLAYAEQGQPIAAGIALPGMGQIYLAVRDGGTTCNDQPLHVSQQTSLQRALVGIDYSKPSKRSITLRPNAALAKAAGQVRAPGCAVVGLCAVASGRAEAHFDAGLEPWDIAAAALLIEEAGGRVSRADGRALNLLDGSQGLIASNGHLHGALLDLLQSDAASDSTAP